MQTALKTLPERTIEEPEGIVSMRIDLDTGKRVSGRNPNSAFEYYMLPYVPDRELPGEETTAQQQPEESEHSDSLF